MTRRRGLLAVGDAGSLTTWSGTPYFFLTASETCGFLRCGLNMTVPMLKSKRLFWNLIQIIRHEAAGGYQYSKSFQSQLGSRLLGEVERLEVTEVISHYQLVPPHPTVPTSFYIDCTLKHLFETHGMDKWLSPSVMLDIFERELTGYRQATHVVAMSRSAERSLLEDYGLSGNKVHCVLAGANLSEEDVRKRIDLRGPLQKSPNFTKDRPFTLGFTGKDWARKGLPRLVEAAEHLVEMGIPTVIQVIGFLPRLYQRHPLVQWAGYVGKNRESDRFLDLLELCDIGCAPSFEEPMGIAPMEYLRLGIPVLCTAAGGLIDVAREARGAAILVPKNATGRDLAESLARVAGEPDHLTMMRKTAWDRREYFGWQRAVGELSRIWAV